MLHPCLRLLWPLLALPSVLLTATAADSFTVGHIVVSSNPIFDESAHNAIFLHRWANALHVNTRDSVILERLSFQQGDVITAKQLEEAQRILRQQPYMRDARITQLPAEADQPAGTVNLLVETWDQWSLLPTVDLGRSGGNNRYSFGIKDDNILGTGMQTQWEYQSDENRKGYKFEFATPLSIIKNARLAASFIDNDDGQASALLFEKPFYTLADERAYGAKYRDASQIDTLRQNGIDQLEYHQDLTQTELYWGMLLQASHDTRQRLRVGITQDKHQFSPLPLQPSLPLPQDRDFLYPWLEWEYLQDDYRVLRNLHLINYNEDINLGWHHRLRLGVETQDGGVGGTHLQWQSQRGYGDNQQLLLLDFQGEGSFATAQPDYFRVSASGEYFYRFTPKWVAYSKLLLSQSRQPFIDEPVALGDNTGLRGYPEDYQHGDQLWLFTAELRNYPNINLYQLAELGWVAFVDVGQASGGRQARYNEVDGPIGAIGIGARIYSSRSSYGNVLHIDFSLPLRDGEHVDGWEWRFEVKNHF